MPRPLLGEILLQSGLIDERQLEKALEHQRRTGKLLGEALVELGYVTPDEVADALAQQLGLPRLRPAGMSIDTGLLAQMPAELSREHRVVPVQREGDSVVVAMTDPLDVEALDAARRQFPDKTVRAAVVSAPEMDHLLGLQSALSKSLADLIEAAEREPDVCSRGDETCSSSPAARIVDGLLREAVARRATDIHLQPSQQATTVLFRIDGVLHEIVSFPHNTHRAVVGRVKVLANMDLSISYLPQDGHFHYHGEDGSSLDVRVSVLPLATGEKIVMRLLPTGAHTLTLNQLGIAEGTRKRLEGLLRRPQGIILVTGPTGSGKTTTLYAALQFIRARGPKNITTIEDPVERIIPGLSQVQVDERRGLTFLTALRAILRQDPDVIMIGETRDPETARTAFQAALTGHLVLTTLHTEDAATAVTRLFDLGLEPYLVAASLIGSYAQRLVRKVCRQCGRWRPIPVEQMRLLRELLGEEHDLPSRQFVATGCPACANLGYVGRTAVAELIVFDKDLAEAVAAGATAAQIKRMAVARGMETMQQAAVRLLRSGVTNVPELLRVLAPSEPSSSAMAMAA